ncbi:putative Major outer membrane lipoprotein [Gammaproteobacteria bacterium]
MHNTIINIAKYSALAIVIGLASGCASSETTRMIEDNQKATAHAAELANLAIKTANEASRKADAAMSTARDAQECCDQVKEATNRVYRKSMNK